MEEEQEPGPPPGREDATVGEEWGTEVDDQTMRWCMHGGKHWLATNLTTWALTFLGEVPMALMLAIDGSNLNGPVTVASKALSEQPSLTLSARVA